MTHTNVHFFFRNASREKGRESIQESAVETILISTDRLLASSGDSAEMVRQARILGQATAQLIQAIKVLQNKEILLNSPFGNF